MRKFKFFNTASAVLLAVFVGAMSFTCGQSDKPKDEVQTIETVEKDSIETITQENDTTVAEPETSEGQDSTVAPENEQTSENPEATENAENAETAEDETTEPVKE